MSINLVIRPVSSDIASANRIERWQWMVLDRKSDAVGDSQVGAQPPNSDAALLLVPTNWLHAQHLTMPAMRRAQLQQAVPFALEEHVAGDIEQLHVSHERNADGTVTAVAIEPALLTGLLDQLQSLGIQAIRVVPDASCQPLKVGGISIFALSEDYLINTSSDCLLLDKDELGFFLMQQLTDANLHWFGHNRPDFEWTGDIQTHLDNDPFKRLTQHACHTSLNLLQGDFAKTTSASEVRSWRIVAGLMVAAGLLSLLYVGSDWWLLNKEVKRYQTEVQTVFRETFPNITNVVNPKEQARRELANINPAQADALLKLLAATAPVFSTQQVTVLESINYDQTGLRLEISATSVAELDELTSALKQQGIIAELDGAVRSGDSVRGQILVSGKVQ